MRRILILALLFATVPLTVYGAYHHGGDTDSEIALQAYPAIKGTKLDSCALCHSGGEYEKKGVLVELGSCQWCHYSYGYDEKGDIAKTLNGYGQAYLSSGKTVGALSALDAEDSDGDGFANGIEIAALRFPGDANDDPTKVPAPYRVLTLDELQAMPSHSQLMLMNTHKSGDSYAKYTGVSMAYLLDDSHILPSATGITVFAPDGWAQYHPLEPDGDPLMYHVYGVYPTAPFYYNEQADDSINTDGWCNYSSPFVAGAGLQNGDSIEVEGGLQMILAYGRDNLFLEPGQLTKSNKLDGEGPFRVVPPQKVPGPPDQAVTSAVQNVVWPFDNDADHNAGYATRSATIIRVEPLPEGTTDVDILEAGWNYVDEGKILIYGNIEPLDTMMAKINELYDLVMIMDEDAFTLRNEKKILLNSIAVIRGQLKHNNEQPVTVQLRNLVARVDGCIDNGTPDQNDLLQSCSEQTRVYWALHELNVLQAIGK
jgi:hypothetical protein